MKDNDRCHSAGANAALLGNVRPHVETSCLRTGRPESSGLEAIRIGPLPVAIPVAPGRLNAFGKIILHCVGKDRTGLRWVGFRHPDRLAALGTLDAPARQLIAR